MYNGKENTGFPLSEMYIVVFTPNQIIPVLHTTAKYLRQINEKAERFH